MDASEVYYKYGQPSKIKEYGTTAKSGKSGSSRTRYKEFFRKDGESPQKSEVSNQSNRKMVVESKQSTDSDAYKQIQPYRKRLNMHKLSDSLPPSIDNLPLQMTEQPPQMSFRPQLTQQIPPDDESPTNDYRMFVNRGMDTDTKEFQADNTFVKVTRIRRDRQTRSPKATDKMKTALSSRSSLNSTQRIRRSKKDRQSPATSSLKSAKLFTVTENQKQNAKMAVEKSSGDLPLQMPDKHKSSYQTVST